MTAPCDPTTKLFVPRVKATGVECVDDLMRESAIYRRLLPIQGRYVPVHLGDIKVDNTLYYAGAVRIVYMMFLDFGGFPIRSPIPARSIAEGSGSPKYSRPPRSTRNNLD